MAFDDANCPCGGRKLPQTMLCEPCLDYLADRRELSIYEDEAYSTEHRRVAAMILLRLARGRRRAQLPTIR